jgi:hypothetical protein
MADEIEGTDDLRELAAYIKEAADSFDDQAVQDILSRGVQSAKDAVQERVQDRGVGSNGQRMKPYERKYLRRRAQGGLIGSTGVKVSGRRVDKVDLHLSGGMWDGYLFKTKTSGNRFEGDIFFDPKVEPIARGNEKKRPFTALTQEEVEIVVEAVGDAVEEMFKISNI